MMTDDEAREALKDLVEKFLDKAPDKKLLVTLIEDRARPGLPIRGVLEAMRKYRKIEYSNDEKKIIEELLYLYG